MVPEYSYETRKVMVTEYQMQQQERMRTVYRQVPRQVEKARTYNVCVPEPRTKMVNYTKCVPVTRPVEKTWVECVAKPRQVERTVTVMVPTMEMRTGMKMVCETYQETVMRNVTRDMGHWETQMVEVPCRSCNSCGRTPSWS